MIFTLCSSCGVMVSVLGKPEDYQLLQNQRWSAGFPCVYRRCGGTAQTVHASAAEQATQRMELTVGQYFRAINGFGVNETVAADPDRVRELLLNDKVVDIKSRPIGEPKRTIIEAIQFAGGAVMYLDSSNHGACVYLIEEDQDADHDLSAVPDPAGHPADRTQGRPAASGEAAGPVGGAGHGAPEHADQPAGPGDGAAGAVPENPTERRRDGSRRSRSNRRTAT